MPSFRLYEALARRKVGIDVHLHVLEVHQQNVAKANTTGRQPNGHILCTHVKPHENTAIKRSRWAVRHVPWRASGYRDTLAD